MLPKPALPFLLCSMLAPSVCATAGNVDQHEQYILWLPDGEAVLVVQRFPSTDDLENEFSSLVVHTGSYKPGAVTAVSVLHNVDELTELQRGSEQLAVVRSRKRSYDGQPATAAAAAAAWNGGGKLRPSGTQAAAAVAKDVKRAQQVVADKTAIRDYYK